MYSFNVDHDIDESFNKWQNKIMAHLMRLRDDMEIRAEMMAAQNAAAKNNIVSFEAQLPNISDFKSDIEAAKTTAQSS